MYDLPAFMCNWICFVDMHTHGVNLQQLVQDCRTKIITSRDARGPGVGVGGYPNSGEDAATGYIF